MLTLDMTSGNREPETWPWSCGYFSQTFCALCASDFCALLLQRDARVQSENHPAVLICCSAMLICTAGPILGICTSVRVDSTD